MILCININNVFSLPFLSLILSYSLSSLSFFANLDRDSLSCYLLSQESPMNSSIIVTSGTSCKKFRWSACGKVWRWRRCWASWPSQSAVGKEGRRMTSLKDKVMKEKCKEYDHRIYQEMNPETAVQLQQNENEVSRLYLETRWVDCGSRLTAKKVCKKGL